jgi:hypothetical protein
MARKRRPPTREWTFSVLVGIALSVVGLLPLGLRGLWWGLSAGCAVAVALPLTTQRHDTQSASLLQSIVTLCASISCGALLVLGFAWPKLTSAPAADVAGRAAVKAVFVELDQDRNIIEEAHDARGLFGTRLETVAYDTQREALARVLPIAVYRKVAFFYSFAHNVLVQQDLLVGSVAKHNYAALRAAVEEADDALATQPGTA